VFPALIYYQGLLEGRQHAIKRCFEKSCPERSSDFENEIRFIPRLQHKNIVKLLGYCKHEKERVLVYEYMPKKSLDKFIFGMFSISQTLLLLYIYLILFWMNIILPWFLHFCQQSWTHSAQHFARWNNRRFSAMGHIVSDNWRYSSGGGVSSLALRTKYHPQGSQAKQYLARRWIES